VPGVGEHRERVGEQADDDLDDHEAGNKSERDRESPPVCAPPGVLVAVSMHGRRLHRLRRAASSQRFTAKLHRGLFSERYNNGGVVMPTKIVRRAVGVAAAVSVLAVGSAVAATPQPPTKPGAGAPAAVIPLRAILTAANVSHLEVASTATGRFVGGLFRSGSPQRGERPNFSWNLFWAVIASNTTGPITGVEIRSGEVSATAGDVFLKLCGPCNVTSAAAAAAVGGGVTLTGGVIRNLTKEQVSALRTDELFVNVMTGANPSGELRGQVTRLKPVTTGAPPVTRMPNPIKPGPPLKVPLPG
jgi:hypothetical protein